MAKLLKLLNPEISKYRDRRFDGTQEQFEECLRTSTTAYVGNLSFYTTEEQLAEVFAKVGDIKRIIMGLDKQRKTPCGFCFVVYYTREDVENAVKFINGTLLDDRPIRVDFDWGFKEGRQFGRGRSGGQVRDEYRMDYDSGRGGYGHIVKYELLSQQAQAQAEQYADGQDEDPEPVRVAKKARREQQAPEEEQEVEVEVEEQRGGRYRDGDSEEEE